MAGVKEKKRSLETGMLSFARSLQPSEGLFWGLPADGGKPQPIEVLPRGVRGQNSQASAEKESSQNLPGRSNPQFIESAVVPQGCNGVRLKFSMWILPHTMEPWACDVPEVSAAYKDLIQQYRSKGGFKHLARLYLWNIANGRFSWRNRFQADAMKVAITFDGNEVVFDPTHPRLGFETPASVDELSAAALTNATAPIEELIAHIERGLSTERVALDVTWQASMQEGQEIFPSQEYLRADKNNDASPSRVYAKLPTYFQGRLINQASMHSQKIGAAIRHVDVWHKHPDYSAIAVNPYGGVQKTGAVLRTTRARKGEDSAKSFYRLIKEPEELFSAIESASEADSIPADVHFVIANLVRGGVFGE
ncbi:MAG: type I-F CRISPR-associated protein Csy3 [Bradyrhizobium sp.]|uniref:type I-F CRISPR-associated protein Csy3 n=1 Tax=Bradyrhizobium sp. TaxID=376 RepID=UPI003D099899